MAFGYLVGKKGVEDSPPAGGWASLDPDGAKATALRDAVMTETRLRNYESRLLQIEMERLRDQLLHEQGAPRFGHELLAFVCNPDATKAALAEVLNDALVASHGMPATIIGGVSRVTVSPTMRAAVEAAKQEDRTCTIECLETELEKRRTRPPSAFLFSGHANRLSGREKTLGFTLHDGTFAPIVDNGRVVRLLCQYARRDGSGSGIELVVLNGCESSQRAQELRSGGVPVVVGWRTVVCDESAYLFVRGFFRSLGQSARRYRQAFEAGKRAITEVQPRQVRSPDGDGVVQVPFFTLCDPRGEGVRNGLLATGSFAAGVPVLYDATSPHGHE